MKTTRVWAWVVIVSGFCTGGLVAQQADSNSATPAMSSPAASQPVPRLILFSGTVKDLAGKPLTGPEDLNFAIYKEQTDAAPLWQETQTLNVDEQGHYTVVLGAMQQEGLPVELFTTGEARWLGVNAGKLPEQARVLLVSVPYALKANDAEMLAGKPASAYALAQPAGASTTAGGTAPGGAASSESAAPGKPKSGPKPNVTGTGTQYYVPLWTDGAGTLGNSVIYQKSGLVGIGTTTPVAKLDVAGSVGHFLVDTSGAQFRFTRGSANYFQAATAGGYFDFVVNGLTPSDATASLKLAANGVVNFMAGNVGIGTLAPAQKLDVSGNLKISGAGNAIIFPDGTVQATAGTGSGGGTITGVAAGSGLTGGGTVGSVMVAMTAAARTRGITYVAGCDNCGVLQSADGQRQFWVNAVGAMTITSVTCFSDAGGPTINLARDNGGPTNLLSSNLTCSTTGASTTSFTSSALNLNDQLDFVMVAADGVARRATVVIKAVLN